MTYTTVSFSGGKDSTAMLLHMMEIGEHIDEVINVDTGMEFPEMYEHIARVRKIVEDNGIKFTVLKAEKSYEYYLLEHPYHSEKYGDMLGYGWPGPYIRWCTKHLKTELIKEYLREHPDIIQCVGLAADEQVRIARGQNKKNRHPLNEWGWTEAVCLQYCRDLGYDWGGLYDIFKRVSCWCCPLSSMAELRNLYRHRPELWARLEDLDRRMAEENHCTRPFKHEYTVADLSRKFAREELAKSQQTDLLSFGVGGGAMTSEVLA